ncbi:MAG: signal peptide peptidase SppA [Planctomycetota bacterium]
MLMRLFAVVVAAMFVAGCSLPSVLVTPVSAQTSLEETVVSPGNKRAKVLIVEVEGMLANTRAGGGILGAAENKVSLLEQELTVAAQDDSVKVVVLRVNSPGGTVAASEAMYDSVRRFKKATGKPVLVQCQDVAASGGYYVACAGDEIYAQNTSIVGSIGVIFQVVTVEQAMNNFGVRVESLKSGPLKDLGSPFNGLDAAEREVMQGMIDDFYAQFTGVVQQHRSVADPSKAFDGRVFTAEQAKDIGLIDGVQSLPSTIKRARELAGRDNAVVVMYRRPYGYAGSIYASSPLTQPTARPEQLQLSVPALEAAGQSLTPMLTPGAYYLWRP